jgi:class 3 adenylate cyclase
MAADLSPEQRLAALEQEYLTRQQATNEVLRVIATSTFDREEVLRAIVIRAVELSGAEFGTIYVREGDVVRAATGAGSGAVATAAYERDHPDGPGRHSVVGRVLLERTVVQIADVLADPEYDQPVAQKLAGFRTVMGVPVVRDDDIVGILSVGRSTVDPFDEAEIALVATFAGQVAIAIEIARLIEEQRIRQSAMTEVLRIIGRSEHGLESALRAIMGSAVRLCRADFGTVYLQDGEVYRIAAAAGFHDDAIREYERERPHRPGRESMTGRVLLTGQAQQITDVLADAEYDQPEAQRISGYRTLLGLPIKREGRIAGVFNLGRADVRPFSEDEMALGATFAEQVAIAIETARQLETIDRQRTELARFVSPQIAALVSSPQGEQLLAGHRRRITAVFCDLRGFSHFSETAEPEEVLELLREYHRALGASIVEHGATLEHFAGDGLLAFLNDPIEQPEHELRAVAMALDMRTRVGELATSWRKRGYELGLGIGVVAGYATLGRIGFEGRYDYGAVGNAVILASRLSSEAAAGQILLDQRTHAAIEDRIEAVPAGELSLKGISRPILAFDVVALR